MLSTLILLLNLFYAAGIVATGTHNKNSCSFNKIDFTLLCQQTNDIFIYLLLDYGTVKIYCLSSLKFQSSNVAPSSLK